VRAVEDLLDLTRAVARGRHERRRELHQQTELLLRALGAPGKAREEREGALEVLDRLAVGVPQDRDVAGARAVLDGAREIAGGLEVRGELPGDLRRTRPERVRLSLADPPVKPDAARLGDPIVEDVLIERVDEPVTARQGSVDQVRPSPQQSIVTKGRTWQPQIPLPAVAPPPWPRH